MKILLVSLFLPQRKAYHAGSRYVFEVLRHLGRRHHVDLATRVDESERGLMEELRPYCRRIYPYGYRRAARQGMFGDLRLVCNYLGFSRYADRLVLRGAYDIVQVEWVETALLMKRRNTPMVLDAHDVITKPAERRWKRSHGMQRLVTRIVHGATRSVERSIVRRFDTIFTMSEFDRRYLQSLTPGPNVRTVPIPAGLDVTDQVYERVPDTILFLASYKYRRVNVEAALWFYREVLPLVRRKVPTAHFIIAGYGPPEDLRALAADDHQVTVPGFVDDLDACYKRARVFVAPILIGGGIIVKILDAMAAGTPVVTTSIGNEGIEAMHERDLLVADTPEEFASAVVRLLTDEELARRLSENGRTFVRRHYQATPIMQTIESAYEDLLKTRRAFGKRNGS